MAAVGLGIGFEALVPSLRAGQLGVGTAIGAQVGCAAVFLMGRSFTLAMPFLGWSATKSVISALIGVLVRDGQLSLDAPAPVPEWRGKGDQRATITLRELLQRSSGLKFVEEFVAGSDASEMLAFRADMASHAARQLLLWRPGTHWSWPDATRCRISLTRGAA